MSRKVSEADIGIYLDPDAQGFYLPLPSLHTDPFHGKTVKIALLS